MAMRTSGRHSSAPHRYVELPYHTTLVQDGAADSGAPGELGAACAAPGVAGTAATSDGRADGELPAGRGRGRDRDPRAHRCRPAVGPRLLRLFRAEGAPATDPQAPPVRPGRRGGGRAASPT